MLPVMVADMDVERSSRQAQCLNSLIGQKLLYVRLGHTIVLSFTGDRQILIETVARLDSAHGRVAVEPDDHPSDDIAVLLGDVVRTAWILDNGTLQLTFTSGAKLLAEVDDDVESWAVAAHDRVLVVCLAGGELAVWG